MERFKWIFLAIMLTGCTQKQDYFPHQIESEHVEIVRFDRALLNIHSSTADKDIRILYSEYEDFMPIFMENILGIPSYDTAYIIKALPEFLGDTTYGFKQTNLKVAEEFNDISDIKKSLNNAFSRIHYLYPEWPIPMVYFFISGFNASVMFFNDDIAVGVDMYLGSDYDFYNRVVYNYQKITMRKECIPTDIVSAYLFRNIPFTSTKNRLLENMIYRGKVMYLLSLIMADETNYDVMGYTQEQWIWCEKNERRIWNTMMDKRDLFQTENMVLTSYLNDGPFTSEISQDAPARLGTWTGWRIVESYMNHNKGVTLQQLMEEGDAQHILENSYYRP